MRILYYNQGFAEDGGLGTHAVGLLRGFEEIGHEVCAIPAPPTCLADDPPRAKRALRLPEIVKTPLREARGLTRASLLQGATVRTAMHFDPELCIVRRFSHDYVLPRLERTVGCPVIAECNSIQVFETRDYWSQHLTPWERRSECAFLRRADLCVAVSAEIAEQLAAVGVRPERVEVIQNGVDLRLFPLEGEVDGGVADWRRPFSVVIGYCATVSAIHDLDTVVAAATAVSELFPDTGFLFVGPTTADLVGAGMNAGLAKNRCLATGRIQHAKVASVLRAADIFWAATHHPYGSLLKLYEYLALGRPIVLAAEGSGVLPVVDACAGAVVPRQDAAALAREARLRIADGTLRREEGESGRRWVEQHGTWAVTASRTIDAAVARGLLAR